MGLLVPYIIAEGVTSIARGTRAGTSLLATAYSRWFGKREPTDPSVEMITDVGQITALLPLLRANAVGLGNSPFPQLATDAAAINRTEDGCLVQKPNLRKTMSYLRSNLFNPFDQMTYFYDTDRPLPPEITGFFARYGFRQVQLTTNEYGERSTLPSVRAVDKVLVAGDSVANGVMLSDDETIASALQRRDLVRQYINLGIARAQAADIVCALEKAAQRYPHEIRELIYVFCENDFSDTEPYGRPDDLVRWVSDFAQRTHLDRVVVLYVPYIYNTAPEITRIAGHSHHDFPTYRAPKQRLLQAAEQAGFTVIDFLDIANAQRRAVGSQFAPLALYVDHTHLSKLGVELLLPRLAMGH